MPLHIREETPADHAAIHALTETAFRHAPHTSHTEQRIVDALREAGALAISLVAEDGGEIVGHVAVSPVALSDGSTGWFGLGPISVAPARQKQGIGAMLMKLALDALRARGAAGCVVLGDPAYYARFGFVPEATLVLPGVPAEYFQAIALCGEVPAANVHYHTAFETG
ncbi:N-acetyltransferase [Paraburkholderia sp. J10-1]|uniref:GNAT family N-acetyltransferase n=1 Tax=Paraburkholderia sp. J10-1 TaxID=2805430 RepID=UPI002AB62712|nr:N-acetyltransferase [Paraburkholderia sp. J10-1]